MSSFMADGANSTECMRELALQKGLISAKLQQELLGPDTAAAAEADAAN
jgi:hypothetical protein